MTDQNLSPQTAIKYNTTVQSDGLIELRVPFARGVHVTVFVIQEHDESDTDLLTASESSIGFWNNPYDDEDWNNA